MSEHPDLVRDGDHDTSIEAAKSIEDELSERQGLVLQVHAAHPAGLTDSELRALIDVRLGRAAPESTYRKRRTELTTLGLIEPTNLRRVNPKGSMECVWRLATSPTLSAASRKQSRLDAAVARETEACARVAETEGDDLFAREVGRKIAAAIRARGLARD